MNEERAGREGSSRDSGGSWDAFGASGGSSPGDAASSGAVPRQAEQGLAPGAGRRRAAGGPTASEFGAAELTVAFQHSVSAIGTSGPPRAGLARIRRRAKARQRRRTVMAGSAGVLLLAMGVAAVTGRSFNIVPVLTGVVGLGGGTTSTGAATSTPQSGTSGVVRTVRPPAAAVGKRGPAIGPISMSATTAAAIAATGVAQCTAADLKTTTSVDSVIGGVSYGHVEAVANTTCAVAGPPVLQVDNAASTAAGSVVILRQESSDGSALPDVSTWGTVLKLQAGQGYDFQFAWAPDSCVQSGTNDPAGTSGTSAASGVPSAAATGTGSAGATAAAANQNSQTAYSLSYLVAGVTPTAPVSLDASCGATVYVTDVYNQGAYPLPQPSTTPTSQPPASSAPASSQSPTTQPPTSGAPSPTSSSPTASSSGTATSSQTATSSSAAGSGATSGANVTAADPASS